MTESPIRTMEEFARFAGLSRPTVSKFFQDQSSVRPRIREKIEVALAQTGFRPNIFAVNLNRRRSKIIGLIFPTSLDPFYMGLRGRIEAEATAAGYLPFVFSCDGKPELEAEAIETLSALNVAGVIMASVGGTAGHHDRLKAMARTIPIVFVDAPFDDEEPFVGTNHAQSVTLITDYLTRLGDSPCYFDMPWVNQNAPARRDAYAETMRRRGLAPVFVAIPRTRTWDFERTAYEQTRAVLRQGGFPTRIVLCGNDRVAFGVLAAVNEAGLKVGLGPDCDLRIAGHDNQPLSEFIWPPLTTVAQNTAEMGRVAVSLLLRRIDGPPAFAVAEAPPASDHVLVNGDLVLRASA